VLADKPRQDVPDTLKAAMLKQRLVASWRLLGKRPFGHPKAVFGHAQDITKAAVKRIA
jgi:hypothetical protein